MAARHLELTYPIKLWVPFDSLRSLRTGPEAFDSLAQGGP
jgi:hypothetical protein